MHRHAQLRARAAVLGHDRRQPHGVERLGWDVAPIVRDARGARELEERAQIGLGEIAQVAGIVAVFLFERGDPLLDQPGQHAPSTTQRASS